MNTPDDESRAPSPRGQFFPDDNDKRFASIEQQLLHIGQMLAPIQLGVSNMALDFTKVNAALTQIKTVEDGIVTLVNTLAAEVKTLAANQQNPADQAALDAFADQLIANAKPMADAVAAGTPVQPAPVAPAAPTP